MLNGCKPKPWSPDEVEAWCAEQERPVLWFVSSESLAQDVRVRMQGRKFFEQTLVFQFRGCGNLSRLLDISAGMISGPTVTVFLTTEADDGAFSQNASFSLHASEDPKRFSNVLQMLCNANSLHFLDYSVLDSVRGLDVLLDRYLVWLGSTGVDSVRCCIDSSGVLAAYGVRSARDLDFIHQHGHVETGVPEIGCHNRLYEELRHTSDFNYSCHDLVMAPQYYFYYRGLKFSTLELTREMKAKRLMLGVRSRKDDLDVRLMDEYLDVVEHGGNWVPRFLRFRRVFAFVLDFRYHFKLLQHRLNGCTSKGNG